MRLRILSSHTLRFGHSFTKSLSSCQNHRAASRATASTPRTLIKAFAIVFLLSERWQTLHWNSLNLSTHLYNRPLCSLVRVSSHLRNSWSVNKSNSRPSKNGLKKVTGLLLPLASDCSRTKPTVLSETLQETMKRPCLSGSFKVTEEHRILDVWKHCHTEMLRNSELLSWSWSGTAIWAKSFTNSSRIYKHPETG